MSAQEVTGLTDQPRNLVSEFRRRLEAQIGRECYELWFAARDTLSMDGNKLTVTATDEFSMDRIKSTYHKEIEGLSGQFGIEELHYLVQTSQVRSSVDSAPHPEPAVVGSIGIENDSVELTSSTESNAETRTTAELLVQPESSASNHPVRKSGNDSGSLSRSNGSSKRVRYSLSDFVFDADNQILKNACKQVINSPGDLSPFYIYGRAGCGKTHLLEGIAAEARKRSPSGKVQMVTAEQFTSDYVGSLKNRTMPMFRKRYRELSYFLVDDLQFFAGKKSTLLELQHTIEVVTRKGGQVIVSADRSPNELDFAGPEFVHRVACGLTTAVQSPSRDTRVKIVRRMAARKGIQLDELTTQFIADEISGDARLISGALNRIKLYQVIKASAVTVEDAKKWLADLFQISRRTVSLAEIENAVCELFGLEQKTLRSSTKVKAVSQPRMLAMWLSRKYTRAALSEIGDYFGGRSHSTVISAQSKVEEWVETSESIGLKHSAFPVENAIRRIEQELRVG